MTDENTPEKKPWGEDAEFDAAKAWTLIQGLRSDKTKLQTDLDAERQARTAAEKAVSDADPEGKLKAAMERAEKAERASAVKDVLLDFPTLKGYEDFLTGTTPEELKASAERLSALNKPAEEQKPEEKTAEQKPGSSTPEPVLTPGHGGAQTATFDPDAIAAAARR